MNLQRLRLIGVALTASACLLGLWHAEQLAAEVRFFGKKASPSTAATPTNSTSPQTSTATATSTNGAAPRPSDKTIKMNYFTRTWSDVLQDIAKQSGRQLIIDKVPPGRFSRNDWNRYSLTDALNIVNRELEPKGFRVLERGAYLDLVFLRDARSEYARPVVGAETSATQPAAGNSTADDQMPPATSKPTGAASVAKKTASLTPDRSKTATSNARRPKTDALIQQAAFEEMDDEDDDQEEMELPEATRRWAEVSLKRQTAQNVSRSLYQA